MSKLKTLEHAMLTYVEVNSEVPDPLIYRVQISCETTGEDIFDEEVSGYWVDARLTEALATVERHQELVTEQVL